MITRHGFGRNSVDSHRRAPPAAPPSDGRGDRFRRGGPSRSTLPPSLIGARSGGDGGGNQVAPSPSAPRRGPVVFTDVDLVVVPNHAVTSSPSSSGSVVADEGHAPAQMSLYRKQPSSEVAVGRQSASSMITRIAPPPSSRSKSSSRPSADKRLTPPAAVGGRQAKKGERLSNYNKGPVPPSRMRSLQSPPPAELATIASGGWAGNVTPPPLDSQPWQSERCPCGSTPVMDTLVEEPDESSSTVDQSPAKLNNSSETLKSPKRPSKLLQSVKLNSPTLRPRTQSMPASTSRPAVGSDLRLSTDGHSTDQVTSSPHITTSPAFAVDPRYINAARLFSSSDCNFPTMSNNETGMIPGSPLMGVWIPKIITPTDNDTCNYLL